MLLGVLRRKLGRKNPGKICTPWFGPLCRKPQRKKAILGFGLLAEQITEESFVETEQIMNRTNNDRWACGHARSTQTLTTVQAHTLTYVGARAGTIMFVNMSAAHAAHVPSLCSLKAVFAGSYSSIGAGLICWPLALEPFLATVLQSCPSFARSRAASSAASGGPATAGPHERRRRREGRAEGTAEPLLRRGRRGGRGPAGAPASPHGAAAQQLTELPERPARRAQALRGELAPARWEGPDVPQVRQRLHARRSFGKHA